jgi:predicted metal-dependent enzyme (double-stranded beta helix superfamily)
MNRLATRAPLRPARLRQVVRGLAASEDEWLSQVRFSRDARWYKRLTSDDDHEVWLLSWLPGQGTGFHDHGGSAGAFTVLQGALQEWTAPGGRRTTVGSTLGPGQVRSFGPWYVHHVINASVEPAVSVHAYSPPLQSMRRFEFGPAGELRVTTETAARW